MTLFNYDAESADAAESVRPISGALQLDVLRELSVAPNGLTSDEVEIRLRLRHQTASARLRELVIEGLAYEPGDTRATSSGRRARVRVITQAGRDALRRAT